MTILTWTLAVAPPQKPEYWLLCVDGNAWCSLANQAPYVGAGQYSVDLTTLDSNVQITDGQPHTFSVALVGSGVIGPQSPAVSATVPLPTLSAAPGGASTAAPVSLIWPTAGSLSISTGETS